MKSRFGMRRSVPATLGLCLIASVAKAGDMPWDERAVPHHVDEATLQGVLSKQALLDLAQSGRTLFSARFTIADGAGRPLATQAIIPTKRRRPAEMAFVRTSGTDSSSCFSCHNLPVLGGAADFTGNAFISEGFESTDFDSVDPQFSNERGSPSLFGVGLIELLAREMTVDLAKMRRHALAEARSGGKPVIAHLVTKGVSYGSITANPDGTIDFGALEGIDPDLVVRPLSQKGVMTSLRQFAINALNLHLGMEASERFGTRWTGEHDFDGDGKPDEISEGDVSALVAFQATLPPPTVLAPADPTWKAAAARGSELFDTLKCSSCHMRALPLDSLKFTDPGPEDAAGTLRTADVKTPAVYDLGLLDWARTLPRNDKGEVMVPLFGDLKRHKIADQQVAMLGNELLAQRFVERDVFKTAELWGVGSTAPYGHRNDITTLDGVIRAHGGEGRAARDAYVNLSQDDRNAVIAFLKTLEIVP